MTAARLTLSHLTHSVEGGPRRAPDNPQRPVEKEWKIPGPVSRTRLGNERLEEWDHRRTQPGGRGKALGGVMGSGGWHEACGPEGT